MAKVSPFILYGDSPALPSGLGRILRDVAARLVAEEQALGIRVATVGVSEPWGFDWQSWPNFRFQPTYQDQGEDQVAAAIDLLRREGADGPPIVLVIFDPSRAFALLQARDQDISGEFRVDQQARLPKDLQIWGYFPIDGHPVGVTIGGPAGELIKRADRVLGYGRYGAWVLRQTRGTPVSYLPHGVEPGAWYPQVTEDAFAADEAFRRWRAELSPDTIVIGVVATNQPRKDYPMVFEAIRPLEERLRKPVALWVHTDFLTKVWDIGELARIYQLTQGHVFASATRTTELADQVLANRYALSDFTIAPGLGEGFGYPILESQLCGTPVVHVAYAGGMELIPSARWLIPLHTLRAEGIYGIQRPVVEVSQVVEACVRAYEDSQPPIDQALWRKAAELYSWEHVWPGWRRWVWEGLEGVRRGA